jgi:hypothetical protein
MDISNVDMVSLEKMLRESNCDTNLINDLVAIKSSYDNYDTNYNSKTLRDLSENIQGFEDSIANLTNNKDNIKIVLSYNSISSLEKYTPIWVDGLYDCNELTRDRFRIKRDPNNQYQKLIKDIYEVMIKCNKKDTFSKSIYPEISQLERNV